MLIKDVKQECGTAGFLRVSLATGCIEKSCRSDVHIFSLSIDYYKHLQMFFYFTFALKSFIFYPELKEILRYIKTLLTHLGEKEGLNTKPGLLETLLESPSFATSHSQG